MEEVFKLPIGFMFNGEPIKELPIAETGSVAETLYTDRPGVGKLHTWFGKVLATSIEHIGDESVSKKYNKQEDKNDIPSAVLNIPFIDAGSLLIQVQRACWEDTLKNQKLTCVNCGTKLDATIDLNRVEIPEGEEAPIEFYTVELSKTHQIGETVEAMKMYEGYKFNRIKFRVATLGDAIRHQGITKNEILFWRKLAFDTMVSLYFEDGEGNITEVPDGYITKRGNKLFSSDFNAKTLREIRSGMQSLLPSAKFYYEEECPECNVPTPFFASVSNFFSI